MLTTTFKGAINYFSTYYILAKDYLIFLRFRAPLILSASLLAGLLYPVPFAAMGLAIYAALSGTDQTSISIGQLNLAVGVDAGLAYAILFAAAVLLFKYLAIRKALDATIEWQTSLFWRGIDRLPHLARWDSDTMIALPLSAGRVQSYLISIVRSGFLIGRVITIGLQDITVVIGALAILTWLDAFSVLLLIAISLLFLPLYGLALFGLAGMRIKAHREREQNQALLRQVLKEGVFSFPSHRIEASRLATDDATKFSSGYAIINQQLQRLNLINLIAGLHIFASVAAIYVFNGGDLSGFVRDKLVFFIILLFMLKAALSLVTLLSRLTRGYSNFAALRAFFYPRRKPSLPAGHAPPDACFYVDLPGGRRYLFRGQPIWVVMPNAHNSFELLALSNALQPCADIERLMPPHIVYLDERGLKSQLEGGPPPRESSEITLSANRQSIRLPVCDPDLDLEHTTVVALDMAAWQLLQKRGCADDFCALRIVFIVIAGPDRPKPSPKEALLVVSDGAEILGAGPFESAYKKYAREAFRRARSKETKPAPETEDEEQEL